MNARQWLTSDDPVAMLEALTRRWGVQPDGSASHLPGTTSRTASERKLFCFAAACAEGGSTIFPDSTTTLVADWAEGRKAPYTMQPFEVASVWARHRTLLDAPAKAATLREVFGNPFAPVWNDGGKLWSGSFDRIGDVGTICESPSHWLTAEVRQLAEAIYQGRAFDDMRVLGDAMEAAGCPDGDLLRHVRGQEPCPKCVGSGQAWKTDHDNYYSTYVPCRRCGGSGWVDLRGPHVAGCHVLDLLTGRS